MKSFIVALILLCFLFPAYLYDTPVASSYDDLVSKTPEFKTPVCMTVNDKYIKSDTPAFLLNGITMVPARVLSSALGADNISWSEATSSAVIKKGVTEITLYKGRNSAKVNGKTVKLDAPSGIFADRFYVPVRFVSETFNTKVSWENETYTTKILATDTVVPPNLIGERGYSDSDIYWLSRIINAESGGEPMEGKVAVGNVVLNRVESELFDDNIYDVIFDTKYGVQFTPTANGTIHNTPTGDSIVAAKRAFLGENQAGKSLYFLNPRISTSFWIVENRKFFKAIGKHDFYL